MPVAEASLSSFVIVQVSRPIFERGLIGSSAAVGMVAFRVEEVHLDGQEMAAEHSSFTHSQRQLLRQARATLPKKITSL